jgi:hypothetical protein
MVRMKRLQPAEIIHRIGIAPGSTTREQSKTIKNDEAARVAAMQRIMEGQIRCATETG